MSHTHFHTQRIRSFITSLDSTLHWTCFFRSLPLATYIILHFPPKRLVGNGLTWYDMIPANSETLWSLSKSVRQVKAQRGSWTLKRNGTPEIYWFSAILPICYNFSALHHANSHPFPFLFYFPPIVFVLIRYWQDLTFYFQALRKIVSFLDIVRDLEEWGNFVSSLWSTLLRPPLSMRKQMKQKMIIVDPNSSLLQLKLCT